MIFAPQYQDKLLLMNKLFALILLAIILLLNQGNAKADGVTISGRQILVNGSPYTIKGICYNPVPRDSDKVSYSNLTEDLALMKEAGINTIRVYSPISDKSVLDEINAAGLKVIIGFGYNQGGKYDILSGSFINYVNTYKNHGAILFWELGNEYNYHAEWFGGDIQIWYRALNDAVELIHKNDPSHPVSTACGGLPDANLLLVCPKVDMWGMNVYSWDNPEGIFSEWSVRSSKPMYLSETGADSYMSIKMNDYEQGENENAQADATGKILESVFKHSDICSGVTLFEFADEWWKAGDSKTHDLGGCAPNSCGVPYDGAANEEYWGILTTDRNKKMAFTVVKEKYSGLTK